MKYYFISGEASGDLHAANCCREILKLDTNAVINFTGGDLMEEVTGKKADVHIKQMAFMGFVEVLKNIRTINKNFRIVKERILKFKPDLLVLVDYPGFNLRMAKWATEQGMKVDFYISPTVWAWKENRVDQIRKYTHKLFVILPFEEAFYKKHNHQVFFTGHPLIDAIEQKKTKLKTREAFINENNLSGKPIIAVLPGSRVQEIEYMQSIMVEVMKNFIGYEFVVAGANAISKKYYEALEVKQIKVVYNQTYELMSYARAGIIKSGTSTLESALLRLPQVVCYKIGAVSFAIGKQLVKVKYISLVNLIMDRPVIKELIQGDFTVQNITDELTRLLNDEKYRNTMLSEYDALIKLLGGPGASAKLASALVKDATPN